MCMPVVDGSMLTPTPETKLEYNLQKQSYCMYDLQIFLLCIVSGKRQQGK